MPDDTLALQQALALGGGGGQPQPPTVPPPDLDLGSGTPGGVPQQAPALTPEQPGYKPPANAPANQPPKPSGMPLLAQFLGQMIKPSGYAEGTPGQPARPLSRLDAFESFVGNFLNSFSQGMSQAGQGPAANARGFGAAMQAPFQQRMQQYQLGQQQQMQQAQAAEAQGRGAEAQARATQMGQMVTLPNGMTMPMALAEKVFPAQIAAQGKVQAAGVQKQFLSTPFGIYDTKAQKYVKGQMAGTVTVTPEMAQQYNMPQQLVGKEVKTSDLIGFEKNAAQQITAVQGAQGPSLVNKLSGKITTLGLGSPAANAVAQAKLQLQQASFERDTFGEWVSNDLAKKYPSLVSISQDGQTLGWKSPVAPTSSIKTQAQQSKDLLDVIGGIKKDIVSANAAGLLGPVEGRWNEFMVGSVGGQNLQFAKLRSEMSFLASGGLKAHFGARGGADMYQHFVDQFNSGKMGAADLIAGIEGMERFFNTYAGRLKTTGGGSNAPAQKLSPGNPFGPK